MAAPKRNAMRQIETRRLESLIPYANNARTHSDEQIAQIAASIKEFGWTNPVLVDGDNGIIAGHGRVLAAERLGMDEAPCIELDGLSEAQRKAYILADNRLAQNAGWDNDLLRIELNGLEAMDFDLSLIGFGEDDLANLMNDPGEGLTDPDAVPDIPEDPVTQLGDVWLLGKHRLVCGDSTNADDVDAALIGRRADVCLTDPPYGLGEGKESGKNDYHGYEDTRENLEAIAADWLALARAHSEAVVFSPGVTNQWLYPEPDWVFCWFYGGGQLRSSWGFNCWQPFLCYGKDPSLASGNGGRPDAVDMNVPANAKDIDHPCPKPVKLWEWLAKRLVFSPNAVLFEPFSGSGTTIIVGEMRGISVAAIELSPAYVDVAVQRWQDFTGAQATLEADGTLFPSIKANAA